jgi:hypothetical protein
MKDIKVRSIYKLNIVILIKKSNLDFYDEKISEEINKLETSFSKKENPHKYVIVAFKTINNINDNILKELAEIVSYDMQRHYYTQINVGLAQDDKKAYFLYSEKYYPNVYYKEGVNLIKKLISHS